MTFNDHVTEISDDCINGVESKKRKVAHANILLTELKPNRLKCRDEAVSYHFPVLTSEEPLPVLCLLAHLGARLHAPRFRMLVGHTRAARTQAGSESLCLWCLLEPSSSSGRSNTTRNSGQIMLTEVLQRSCIFSIQRTENGNLQFVINSNTVLPTLIIKIEIKWGSNLMSL